MITPDGQEAVQERSPWFVALGIVLAVFIISALMLLYYLTPGGGDLFQESVRPTASTRPVHLTIGGHGFVIPANYIEYASTRRGGKRHDVYLFARLPDLDGWTSWQADRFTDNSPDSQILYLTLRDDPNHLTEQERLKRVYGDYVENLTGKLSDFGLRRLTFRKDSGYLGRDLFVGETETGPVIMICEKRSKALPSPNCLRDQRVEAGVGLRIRFKRVWLKNWKDIATHTDALIATFRKTDGANRAS